MLSLLQWETNIYWVLSMGQALFWGLYILSHLIFTAIVWSKYYVSPTFQRRKAKLKTCFGSHERKWQIWGTNTAFFLYGLSYGHEFEYIKYLYTCFAILVTGIESALQSQELRDAWRLIRKWPLRIIWKSGKAFDEQRWRKDIAGQEQAHVQ